MATFQDFIRKFPIVELPVRLNKDTHHIFSQENKPLNEFEIKRFILPYEDIDFDNLIEYVPCFSLKVDYDFHAIVYWRAGLLTYEYFLVTYNLGGEIISHKKIAGLVVYGDMASHAIAMIDEESLIYVVEGEVDPFSEENINPQSTNSYSLEILTDGQIVFTENEGLYSL